MSIDSPRNTAPLTNHTHTGRSVRLCHLYPEEMNIYADRGNIAVLRQRLAWRGYGLEVTEAGMGVSVDPDVHDLWYMSGGQDRDQMIVAEDLVANKADAMRSACADGAAQLFVCGGIQLAGHRYAAVGGVMLRGAGVLDLETTAGDTRLIGDLVITAELVGEKQTVVGYENHAGRTHLGTDTRPLGTVTTGHGNNDTDGVEGAITNRTIGTYLHGPLLPKNPWFADVLLRWALEHRYDTIDPFPKLDDTMEREAHANAIRRAGVAR